MARSDEVLYRIFVEVSTADLGIAHGGARAVCARDWRRGPTVVVTIIPFEEDDGKLARTD